MAVRSEEVGEAEEDGEDFSEGRSEELRLLRALMMGFRAGEAEAAAAGEVVKRWWRGG